MTLGHCFALASWHLVALCQKKRQLGRFRFKSGCTGSLLCPKLGSADDLEWSEKLVSSPLRRHKLGHFETIQYLSPFSLSKRVQNEQHFLDGCSTVVLRDAKSNLNSTVANLALQKGAPN